MNDIFDPLKKLSNIADETDKILSLDELQSEFSSKKVNAFNIVVSQANQESVEFSVNKDYLQNVDELSQSDEDRLEDKSKDYGFSSLKIVHEYTLLNENKNLTNRRHQDLSQTHSSFDLSNHLNESSSATTDINLLLNQNSGWIGNTTNLHQTAIAQLQCNCPACCINNLLANGQKNENSTLGEGNLTPQAAIASLSGDPQIDGILSSYKWGFSWGNRQLSYSFYESSIFNGTYYGSETGVKEVSEGIKSNVRSILNWIETIINIDFVEVTETANNYGRMRFMLSDNPDYAYAYYPSSDYLASVAGDVHLKPGYDDSSDTNGFQNLPGKHGYMSLIHEIGHTLGLQHPHDSSPTLPAAEDNTTNTVMTYNFTGSSAGTFMPYDIKALQYLYGAKENNTGNNTYQFTKVDQFAINGQSFLNTTNSTKQTIWDSSGVDTLDFSNLAANSSGYRFDLNPGGILSTKTAYNGTSYSKNSVTYKTTTFGTAIAYNVLLENLVNSTSNDEIFANSAANQFSGYSSLRTTGNDILWNTNAQDTLNLSGYTSAAVTQTQNGNDLILGLGSKGSITVKNYYVGEKIKLLFGDTFNLSLNNVTTQEGNSGTTPSLFSVVLSSASTQTVTVAYSTADGIAKAGQDYISTNGTLTFAPGETQKTIAVGILGNLLNSASDRNFFVNLSNATGNATISKGQGTGTIVEDDFVPTFFINDVTVNEGDKNATFTVNLSTASNQIVTVNYGTANGSATASQDYTAINGTLTFNAGEVSKTIIVAINDDKLYEQNSETFFVNLSNAQNATITDNQGVGTIENNDALPSISINNYSRQEGSSTNSTDTINFKFTVNLSNASTQTVTVRYATANNTAIAGSDYISKNETLTFNPGETSKTLTVKVYTDKVVESNESFFVNLSNPTNATLNDAQALGTITNDDVAASIPSQSKPNTSLTVAEPDLLTGVASHQTIIAGSDGADSFVLGDTAQAYYTQAGNDDCALITDFNRHQGDAIQLHGKATDYQLATASTETAIFWKKDNVEELIGVVQGVSSLSLESSAFSFV